MYEYCIYIQNHHASPVYVVQDEHEQQSEVRQALAAGFDLIRTVEEEPQRHQNVGAFHEAPPQLRVEEGKPVGPFVGWFVGWFHL